MKNLICFSFILILLTGCSSMKKTDFEDKDEFAQHNYADEILIKQALNVKTFNRENNANPTKTDGIMKDGKKNCPIDTPDKAFQAVIEFLGFKDGSGLEYSVYGDDERFYKLSLAAIEFIEQGGTGTVGLYKIDKCTKKVWDEYVSIPDELIGTWNGTIRFSKYQIVYSITKDTITVNGKMYQVDSCELERFYMYQHAADNDIYSISWNLDDFKKRYGDSSRKQLPFILSYDESKDELIDDGMVLKRVPE